MAEKTREQVQAEMVQTLEKLVAKARAGSLESIGIVHLDSQGNAGVNWYGFRSDMEALGAMDFAQAAIRKNAMGF